MGEQWTESEAPSAAEPAAHANEAVRACGHCGTELPARARFCTECGAPVPDAPNPVAETVAPPPLGAAGVLGALLGVLAGIALIVAAFLPWFTTGGAAVKGWDATGDAKALLVVGAVGIILGAIAFSGVRSLVVRVLLFAAAVTAGVVIAVDIRDINRLGSLVTQTVRLGPGPWVVVGAAGAFLVAALLARSGAPRARQTVAPASTGNATPLT